MSNDGQNMQNSQDDQETDGLQPVQGPDNGRGGSDEAANNPGYQDQESSQKKGSPEKDPKDWVTGDEDATPAQKSYLSTMAVEAREPVPDNLTKAEASEKIQDLQEKTGRDASSERP